MFAIGADATEVDTGPGAGCWPLVELFIVFNGKLHSDYRQAKTALLVCAHYVSLKVAQGKLTILGSCLFAYTGPHTGLER